MILENKVALITGASKGIGKSIALEFANEGASIIINYNKSEKEALELVNKINKNKNYLESIAIKADISHIEEISEMVDKIISKYSHIDILVNNASIYYRNSFFDSNEKIWGEIIDTNLRGTYFCSKFVSEHMLKGDEGVIINIASNAGHIPRKDEGVEYGISKAGVIYLTKSLALTLAPSIRVNCISPGYTNTEMSKFFTDDKLKEEVQSKIPLKRINDPENIAKLALFLTSPSSRNITGQNIIIDGGFSL